MPRKTGTMYQCDKCGLEIWREEYCSDGRMPIPPPNWLSGFINQVSTVNETATATSEVNIALCPACVAELGLGGGDEKE